MGKYDDLDAFWDLGKLMPKKKKLTPFNTSSSIVEHEIAGEDVIDKEIKLTSVISHKELNEIEEHSYETKNYGLIKKVSIIRTVDKYDFYGNFRKAAIVYYDYKTDYSH